MAEGYLAGGQSSRIRMPAYLVVPGDFTDRAVLNFDSGDDQTGLGHEDTVGDHSHGDPAKTQRRAAGVPGIVESTSTSGAR